MEEKNEISHPNWRLTRTCKLLNLAEGSIELTTRTPTC
jgi:hypothetical protein